MTVTVAAAAGTFLGMATAAVAGASRVAAGAAFAAVTCVATRPAAHCRKTAAASPRTRTSVPTPRRCLPHRRRPRGAAGPWIILKNLLVHMTFSTDALFELILKNPHLHVQMNPPRTYKDGENDIRNNGNEFHLQSTMLTRKPFEVQYLEFSFARFAQNAESVLFPKKLPFCKRKEYGVGASRLLANWFDAFFSCRRGCRVPFLPRFVRAGRGINSKL